MGTHSAQVIVEAKNRTKAGIDAAKKDLQDLGKAAADATTLRDRAAGMVAGFKRIRAGAMDLMATFQLIKATAVTGWNIGVGVMKFVSEISKCDSPLDWLRTKANQAGSALARMVDPDLDKLSTGINVARREAEALARVRVNKLAEGLDAIAKAGDEAAASLGRANSRASALLSAQIRAESAGRELTPEEQAANDRRLLDDERRGLMMERALADEQLAELDRRRRVAIDEVRDADRAVKAAKAANDMDAYGVATGRLGAARDAEAALTKQLDEDQRKITARLDEIEHRDALARIKAVEIENTYKAAALKAAEDAAKDAKAAALKAAEDAAKDAKDTAKNAAAAEADAVRSAADATIDDLRAQADEMRAHAENSGRRRDEAQAAADQAKALALTSGYDRKRSEREQARLQREKEREEERLKALIAKGEQTDIFGNQRGPKSKAIDDALRWKEQQALAAMEADNAKQAQARLDEIDRQVREAQLKSEEHLRRIKGVLEGITT